MAMTAAKLRTRVEATKRALRMLEGGVLRTRVDLFPGAEGEWPVVALRSLKDRGLILHQRGFGVTEYKATARGSLLPLEGGAIDETILELLYPNGAPPVTLDPKMSEEDAKWLENLGWDLKGKPAPSSAPVAPEPSSTPEPVAEVVPEAEPEEVEPAETVASKLEALAQQAVAVDPADQQAFNAALMRMVMALFDHFGWVENRMMTVDGNVKKLLKALGE